MWSPTHVQVLVKRAKGLKIKGKDGTNDAFVTIGLGKEKFQTSVKEKAADPVEWCEQCELSIPSQGNRAEILLTVLHRNFMGVDEFLGQVSLPLQDFDVYEKPKTKWYSLKCKPGQTKTDYRGELEVKCGFTVKATESTGGSTTNLAVKNKGSLTSLNKVAGSLGGSLISLGGKEKKNIKKLAKSVGQKVEKASEKARKSVSSMKLNKGGQLDSLPEQRQWSTLDRRTERGPNQDPGVNSDDEDDMFQFDTLSNKSSMSSLNTVNKLGIVSATSTPVNGSLENLGPIGGLGGVAARNSFKFNDRQQSARLSTHDRNPKISINNQPVLDDWEAKLLGKKTSQQHVAKEEDNLSVYSLTDRERTASVTSQVTVQDNWMPQPSPHLAREDSVEKGSLSSLPTYSEVMDKKSIGTKKMIIPVETDSDSSPSPDSSPSEFSPTPLSTGLNSQRLRRSFHAQPDEVKDNKRTGMMGRLKNSYSFKDQIDDKKVNGRKNSVDSTGSRHSRTMSDTSLGPPAGTRVVVGRETSPIPPAVSKTLPQEVMERFKGQSREDIIEMVISLQATVEQQARKVGDLEDYIDSLLMRVMETAPILLQKDPIQNKTQLK